VSYIHPDYEKFTLEDFTFDSFFKEWVLYPSPEQDEFWMRWMKSNPEKIQLLDEARELVLSIERSKIEMSSNELKTVWGQIQENVQLPKKTFETQKPRRFPWRIAAGILALFVLTLSAYWMITLPKKVEFVTSYGEKLEINLPDSSREIMIEGEAFFDVVHKVDHQPFRVLSSKGVTIEVLGTEFNVYNRSEETEVILNSGLVTLSFPVEDKEGKIVMEPGDLVKFKDNKFQKERVDTSLYTSWKDNNVNLDQTSLSDMVKMAKENYGVMIEVQNEEALNLTASGSMPLSDADSFLHQIALIFNVELTKENNKYLIK